MVVTSPTSANSALLPRSEEHTSELQSPCNLVCGLLLEKDPVSYGDVLAGQRAVGGGVRGDLSARREASVVAAVTLYAAPRGGCSTVHVDGFFLYGDRPPKIPPSPPPPPPDL